MYILLFYVYAFIFQLWRFWQRFWFFSRKNLILVEKFNQFNLYGISLQFVQKNEEILKIQKNVKNFEM